jgi:DNA-binding CsgD family transcriptional regulator
VEVAEVTRMFRSSASDYTILETLGHNRRTVAEYLARAAATRVD